MVLRSLTLFKHDIQKTIIELLSVANYAIRPCWSL